MKTDYQIFIKTLGKKRVKVAEPMANHTTFGIGGPADLFYEANSKGELIKAVKFAHKFQIPLFILGSGSNILVADDGFRGLVIRVQNTKYKIQSVSREKGIKIIAGAGLKLSELVSMAIEKGLTGLEFAVGIPGTVGGALRGNAGAWQQSIGGLVSSVKILNPNGEVEFLKKEDCHFSYRQSRFKRSGEIILEINFKLKKGDKKIIEKSIITNQNKRLGQPKEPSAGCVFVNPKASSAGLLIEQCGLKGKEIGGAKISSQHANFIVNTGKATATDVYQLINLVKEKVKNKFGIELKEEICLLGFED